MLAFTSVSRNDGGRSTRISPDAGVLGSRIGMAAENVVWLRVGCSARTRFDEPWMADAVLGVIRGDVVKGKTRAWSGRGAAAIAGKLALFFFSSGCKGDTRVSKGVI